MEACKKALVGGGSTYKKREEVWQNATRVELEAYEKAMSKEVGKQKSKLRGMRDQWTRAAADHTGVKAVEECLARSRRYERALTQLKIQAARARSEFTRKQTWALETRESVSLFGLVKPPGRGSGDIAAMRTVQGVTTRSQRGIQEVHEEHLTGIFTVHDDSRGTVVEQAKRREKREASLGKILGAVKAHRQEKELTGVMQRLTRANILSLENIRAAQAQVKKGTVPAEDGFPTEFYNASELQEDMAQHLQGLFGEIWESGDMTEAMKEAVISVCYTKAKGRTRWLLSHIGRCPLHQRRIAYSRKRYSYSYFQ